VKHGTTKYNNAAGPKVGFILSRQRFLSPNGNVLVPKSYMLFFYFLPILSSKI